MFSHALAAAKKFSDIVLRVSNILLLGIMAVMVLITGAQVFCRYVLNQALSWPEELNVILMAWVTFVGSGIAMAEGTHMGVTFFVEHFSEPVRRVIYLIGDLAVALFLLAMTYYGYQVACEFTEILSDDLEIPMIYPRLSIFVGGILMLIHLIVRILNDLNAFRPKKSAGAPK